jgi:hypothetical protein
MQGVLVLLLNMLARFIEPEHSGSGNSSWRKERKCTQAAFIVQFLEVERGY